MPVATEEPFALLLDWLKDDRRAGMPWTREDFAQRVNLACQVTPGGLLWEQPILDTHDAWRDAYTGKRAGRLEQFAPRSLIG